MKSQYLAAETVQLGVIRDLTAIFESIASMRIAGVKDKVVTSQNFFDELWAMYSQLRVDPNQRLAARSSRSSKPNIYVVLTSEGGLSGDIDERIIRQVKADFDPKTTDIVVIGAHGATLLAQEKLPVKRFFRLPDVDQAVDVGPIIQEVSEYAAPKVYYTKYLSLAVQEVDRIDLLARARSLGEAGAEEDPAEVISTRDYLFEPSTREVVTYLESVMLEIALGQVILESRLAQFASRFNAMSAAHHRANEMYTEAGYDYRRAKRREGDERLKEIINAMKLA